MKWNWKSLGYFSPTERRALLLTLAFATVLFAAPKWALQGKTDPPLLAGDDQEWLKQHLEKLEIPSFQKPGKSQVHRMNPLKPVRFDPNQVTAAQLEAMGIVPYLARNWERYLQKGGKFRQAESVRKLYGMTDPVFEALTPFMTIGRQDSGNRVGQKWVSADSSPVSKSYYRKKTCDELEINTSDSVGWESLPGIGPVLASRILKFRQRLGGFVSVDQVRETYGLPDSTFQKIRPCLILATAPKKLAINLLGEEELKSHPYIGYKLAKTLTAYRQHHGPFRSVEDLFPIQAASREAWEKLGPYLDFSGTTPAPPPN
ncbi:MAG: helix-hairpin-helix domain-containing protein [Haliscomenobacter sp.]|nr:helix-hairpin-helix domain-containing protein [Haliscomenobacter sp.]MBP9075763.1 helix-hairpin-helix domain-containing protein [Haliscomenobacter sp.]MBP9874009.1 helix-hairpin-helix domain-containing protein [Haliscomenobacter sp.]